MASKGTRDAYGKTLLELGRDDKRIVALDADLSSSTRTVLFAKAFPERFFNAGVAEADMIGTAAGLASVGLIPFASTFAVFGTGRCYDQIRQAVCISQSNVKIVVTHGGITVGEDGATHQMIEDVSLMSGLPNMRVIVPADAHQAEAAVRLAARTDGPFFIRLSREKFPVIYEENPKFELGKADILREGKDLTFVAMGLMVSNCLEASEILSKEGIEAEVINCASVKPIDKQTLVASAKKTGIIVTAEEHSVIGGLGSQVLSAISEECPVPLKTLGIEDRFGLSGKPGELVKYFELDPESIARKAKEFLGGKKR
ncbi:MAG TPA: transketolase family protein [Acidobacteriota bacterium]|jgi:transketolase|nr:transketolase family protein [Acidobacteriota bacterium]HNT17731.1 transketolase family protein [Acidobacteriota bacterium]